MQRILCTFDFSNHYPGGFIYHFRLSLEAQSDDESSSISSNAGESYSIFAHYNLEIYFLLIILYAYFFLEIIGEQITENCRFQEMTLMDPEMEMRLKCRISLEFNLNKGKMI